MNQPFNQVPPSDRTKSASELRSANRERGNEALAYLRSRYVRYWPWFLLGALLGPLLAFAYLASIPATYRVSGTLLLPDAGAESAARPSAASLREEAEILTSPRLLEQAVAGLAQRGSPQRTGGPAGPKLAGQTAAQYRQNLTVAPVGPTAAAVQLSLLTTAPEQGRALVNQLVQVYSRKHRQRRQRPVLDTIRNIDRRLRALAQAPAEPPPPSRWRRSSMPACLCCAWAMRTPRTSTLSRTLCKAKSSASRLWC